MRWTVFCRINNSRYLWFFSFCYIVLVSLLFQKLVLPGLPAFNAGAGLMRGDPTVYQHYAVQTAKAIHSQGWSAWSLWSPKTNMSANVAILAALYALFCTTSPALIIPVNAVFQATSACLISWIARELWPGKVGHKAGLAGALIFIMLPSALTWYSQPMKDSYLFAGALLVLYAVLQAIKPGMGVRRGCLLLMQALAGIVIIVAVKPYYLRLFVVFLFLSACVAGSFLALKKRPQRLATPVCLMVMMVMAGGVFMLSKPYVNETGVQYADWGGANGQSDGQAGVPADGQTGGPPAKPVWTWRQASWLSPKIEQYAEILAKTRAGMIAFNQQVNAGSLIDGDRAPNSVAQMILYMPRALEVAVLAPFPNMLIKKQGVMSKLAIMEMALCYLLLPGLFFAVCRSGSLAMAVVLLFSAFFMAAFGFVMPNIGTLMRYRYAYEILLMMIGLGGWLDWHARKTNRSLDKPSADNN